jgi:cellulose synthase/poly-beta-1,6-N-acetylglucosamine synthase-like glycosyltransferase
MDAGAIPGEGSICKLIMAMEKDKKLGGVCGTMRILLENEEKVEDSAMDIITSTLTSCFSIKKC